MTSVMYKRIMNHYDHPHRVFSMRRLDYRHLNPLRR